MRTIGVVTSSRADLGIYLPVLRAIQAHPSLRLRVIATGMHLSVEHGLTVELIEASGIAVDERIDSVVPDEGPNRVGRSIARGLEGFAVLFARWRPEVLMVLGDRFDMYPAALAALPWKVPVAHLHGGELTEGAIDDALRHSLTKLSHLHFVSTHRAARRVIQLGEEPWRVVVSGAPALDQVATHQPLAREQLEAHVGLSLTPAPLLVTYHPVTLEVEQAAWQLEQLLTALSKTDRPVVITPPNADPGGSVIADRLRSFARTHPRTVLVRDLGTRAYFSLMRLAAAMVGNSSSGLLEAPSFGLPVVNVGTRQQGRERAANVIDVGYSAEEIFEGLANALDPAFRRGLDGLTNPYGDGRAAPRIVARLAEVPLDHRLIAKRFVDVAAAPSELAHTVESCP